MDFGAYLQISDLESIAKSNNINISRCRGYRLMKYEEPVDINQILNSYDVQYSAIDYVIGSNWRINSSFLIYGSEENEKIKKLCPIKGERIGIRWNLIHGKKRKCLKYILKKYRKNVKEQYSLWNKYAGRNDVLYIHARLGTNNWSGENHFDYKDKQWYLDSINDYWDHSYCDIYAKRDPDTIPNNLNNKENNNGKD